MPRPQNPQDIAARRKLLLLAGMLLAWSLLIAGRLFQLQLMRHADYMHQAAAEQQRTFDLTPPRGVIYDRNGKSLALPVPAQSIYAFPSQVPDLREKLTMVANICGLDPAEVIGHCEGKTFCWVARKVDSATASRVRDLKLLGVGFHEDTQRSYPNESMAAHVVGYVGMEDRGLSGVELKYDDDLVGEPGRAHVMLDARGKYFSSIEQQTEPGQNLILTIDQNIQYIAERELDRAMKETSARSGTVVVENPHTGEVLALANSPTFNPNQPRKIDPRALQNPAVSFPYEPGSTFKIITVSAALEEKVTKPEEIIDCGHGSIVVGGLRIHDHKAFSALSVSDIIANSSDVGAIRLAERLGKERLYKYIQAFGLGKRTGIELPSETRGMTRPVEKWNPSSIGAISMGQEIGLSAVQLTAVLGTIANDGVYVAPRIVAAETPPSAGMKTVQFQPAESHRVVSTTTAAQMREMLQGVVLRGTGTKALLQGYTSAGKTGTAQRKDDAACEAARNHVPGAKCHYSKTEYVGSFAGFAPLNNPAVVIVVILDSAKGLHQGGQVSAPVFTRIAQQTLAYLNVPHDVDVPMSKQMQLAMKRANAADLDDASPDSLSDPLEVAQEDAPVQLPAHKQGVSGPQSVTVSATAPSSTATISKLQSGVQPLPPASASNQNSVVAATPSQGPANDGSKPANRSVVVGTGNDVVVPSFMGKRMRDVIASAQGLGLEVELHGSGVAREQLPVAGTHVQPGARIAVRLAR